MGAELAALRADLARAARCFRLGATAAGNDALVAVVDGLFAALGEPAAGVDAAALAARVEAVVAAQGRGDWLCLADLLEHEIAPLLDA